MPGRIGKGSGGRRDRGGVAGVSGGARLGRRCARGVPGAPSCRRLAFAFPRAGVTGIPVLSFREVGDRVTSSLINNGEKPPQDGKVQGGSRAGSPVRATHLSGGDREVQVTRGCGTTRATWPFERRDHAPACFSHADASLRIKGVGMT